MLPRLPDRCAAAHGGGRQFRQARGGAFEGGQEGFVAGDGLVGEACAGVGGAGLDRGGGEGFVEGGFAGGGGEGVGGGEGAAGFAAAAGCVC